MGFAAAIVRVIEEYEVILALKSVGASAVTKPSISTQESVMNKRNEA